MYTVQPGGPTDAQALCVLCVVAPLSVAAAGVLLIGAAVAAPLACCLLAPLFCCLPCAMCCCPPEQQVMYTTADGTRVYSNTNGGQFFTSYENPVYSSGAYGVVPGLDDGKELYIVNSTVFADEKQQAAGVRPRVARSGVVLTELPDEKEGGSTEAGVGKPKDA